MEKIDSLLSEAKAGNKNAEEAIFEYFYVRFKTFATHKQVEGYSHDIAIEACKIILQKYKNVKYKIGFEAWAHGVFMNVIRNYYRSSRIRKQSMIQEQDFDGKIEFSSNPDLDLRLALSDCLEKILKVHPRYARVLNLIIQGYNSQEISRKLDITTNNFYVVLNRGRVLLRKCLESGRV